MASLAENLIRLNQAKEDIADAIVEMGGTASSTDGLEDMPDAIRTIQAPSTYAFLYVTTTSGSTVTVNKGQTALEPQTSISGEELLFMIPESGTWYVSSSDGMSDTINIQNQTTYSVNLLPIYGVSWDKSSNTSLTRTDAASNFSEPVAYMDASGYSGSSPFDTIMPWSGITKETINENVMIKIPKFWYKITDEYDKLSFQISPIPITGFYVSPAHADRGDNEGERDYVYIARYKSNNTNYKSTTNSVPMGNITRADARTGCKQQGTGSNIAGWYQQDFAMFWTIRLLYIVEFASWNSREKIGWGGGNGSSIVNTGTTDSMPYHTGTIETDRSTASAGIQYRWIENPYGNIYEWLDGLVGYAYSGNGQVYVKNNPNEYSDSYGGTTFPMRGNSGYSGGWNVSNVETLEYVLTPQSGGTDSTYIPDYCNIGNGSATTITIGAYYYYPKTSPKGLFSLHYEGNTTKYSYIGTRLMYLPPNSNS